MSDPSRSEFGDFLRSRRAKLNPKSVGLPDGRRRRAPGLRREEVAELAGIGVDWYIRLLLTRLRNGSPEFAEWWEAHDIRGGAGGVKRLRHPKKGMLRFAHASFQANDDPDLKLIIYTPA